MENSYSTITTGTKCRALSLIFFLACFFIGTAQAHPVQFQITYTNPLPSDSACLGFAIDPVTSLIVLPETVGATFDFDSSLIPSGNLSAFVAVEDLIAANLQFGDGAWDLMKLRSFMLGINPGGLTFNSLGYEFDVIETETTSDATSVDVGFQLTIHGTNETSNDVCDYHYQDSDQAITDLPDVEPEEEPFAHKGIAPLVTQIKLLGEEGRFNSGELQSLNNQLGLAHYELASANPAGARQHLESFSRKILKAAEKEQLLPEETKLFIDAVGVIQQLITDMEVNQFGVVVPEICLTPTPCLPTTFFVDVNASIPRQQMDGSPLFPFDTLTRSLARAESLGLQCVDLSVSAGTYVEGAVSITRNTSIFGEPGVLLATSLQNYGGHSLRVEDVVFVDSGLRGADVASIDVDGACASTSITNVNFINVGGHAVLHSGGSLEMISSLAFVTDTQADDPRSGVALWLSDGVDACLSNVNLNSNLGGAMVAEGTDTRVFVSNFFAQSNLVNPLIFDRSGSDGAGAAVEVRDNALLLVELAVVNANEHRALDVRDGAQAHVRNTIIGPTYVVPYLPPSLSGGINAAVRRASMVLTSFNSTGADLTGVQVVDSTARASNGYVDNNAIGASVLPESSPLTCLEDNVLYTDNGVNLDGVSLPVPDPSPPSFKKGPKTTPPEEGKDPADGCAVVIFDHPWCSTLIGL